MTPLSLVTEKVCTNSTLSPADKMCSNSTFSPSDRDLRRELQDAQHDRDAADSRAKIARDIFDRAERTRREVADHVARLRAEMNAARRLATERAARGFTEALRSGAPLPVISAPAADNAALVAAQDRHDALEMAANALALEADKTADAAARSAATVQALVTAITEADARALCADEAAAFARYWQIRDRLAGYLRVDETKLADIGDDIAKGLNRQARLAAKDPLLQERGHWMDFLDKIASGAERQWRDYARRLTLDASARFEESSQ